MSRHPALLVLLALSACDPDGLDTGLELGLAPTLTAQPADRPLTDLAQQAVDMSPTWLQQDLALNLRQLDDTTQDGLGLLIVDEDEPWLLDEIGFGIAHVSPEVLADDDFYPELLTINAELIYARDEDLAYVELVEVGEPGEGEWYTTTRYKIGLGGEVVEREIDRDLYYWYVVHPRIEDEHPWFIDGFTRCMSSDLECATDPDSGMLWREFLWDGAEEECYGGYCPVLRDHLSDATVLWDEEDPSTADGAIASIMSFMLLNDETEGRWFSFGAGSERSVQPNRIYGLGQGNCGEWADMTTALSRTGLIANLNATPSSWDHTWNAFFAPGSENWTSEWIPWEPVNGWLVHAYGSSFATYATRGDTLSWHQSADYTDSFDMVVVVSDANGAPVDGAAITIWSPYDTIWWFAGETVTDAAGSATIPLGAEQDYAIQVGAAQGWYPSETNITYASQGVAAGETDVIEVTLEGALPTLEWSERVSEGDAVVDVALAMAGARVVRPSWRFEESYALEVDVPEVDVFVVDADNLALLRAGELFEGTPLLGGSGTASLPQEGSWYVVVPNLGVNALVLLGELAVGVTASDGSDWTVQDSTSFELLPGDVAAMEIAFE